LFLSNKNYSPYIDDDELTELLEQQQPNQNYQKQYNNYCSNNYHKNGNRHVSLTSQQNLQSILKKNGEGLQQRQGNSNLQKAHILRNKNQQVFLNNIFFKSNFFRPKKQ
jgi:hypothetical protein